MSIALFVEPLPGTAYGIPVLVLGFDERGSALCIEADGGLTYFDLSGLTVEWRYDQAAQTWRYTYADAQDIGGEEVQGDLRDPDGDDGGDKDTPGDNEGGDMDTGEK